MARPRRDGEAERDVANGLSERMITAWGHAAQGWDGTDEGQGRQVRGAGEANRKQARGREPAWAYVNQRERRGDVPAPVGALCRSEGKGQGEPAENGRCAARGRYEEGGIGGARSGRRPVGIWNLG